MNFCCELSSHTYLNNTLHPMSNESDIITENLTCSIMLRVYTEL